LWEFVFYASFGVVVTSSVALAGVLLVFSFLIMPAAVGVLFAATLPRQLAIGWIVGALASAAGLTASYAADLPTGAAMVCSFGGMLALAGIVNWLSRRSPAHAMGRILPALRWCVAAILAGSGILVMAAPRADHPLLDSVEAAFPQARRIYFT